MVRLVSPGGIEVLACEEAAPRLLAGGFAEAKPEPEPEPETEPEPEQRPRTRSRKTAAKTKGA